MPLNKQAKKGVTVLAEVIDPDYQEGTGQLLYNGGKEKYVWNTGDPLGHLLVLLWSVIKVNKNQQQYNLSSTTNGLDFQEWRFGLPHQVKNHDQLRCYLRAKGIPNG